MTTVRATSNKGQEFLRNYRRSYNDRLSDCYGRYSAAKARAEKELLDIMRETGGHGFRIMSYCRMFFTCGWVTAEGDLRVETPSHTFIVKEAGL